MPAAKKTTDKETKTTKTTKTAAEKTTKTTKAAKAKEATVEAVVQFQGKNIAVNDLVEAVKAAYKAEGNEDAVESVALYIQPENNAAYYVVNGKSEGKCIGF